MIRVLTLEVCPRCEQLKEFLKKEKIEYEEMRMDSAEGITEMRVNGYFGNSAPVIQCGYDFFGEDDLFDGQNIRGEKIKEVIENGEKELPSQKEERKEY